RKPALVIGESGSGRGHVARVLLNSVGDTSPIVTLNLANDTAEGMRSNLAALRSGSHQRLLLRDIDRAPAGLSALDVLLSELVGRGAHVVATAADARSITELNIASHFSMLVQVPSLRA